LPGDRKALPPGAAIPLAPFAKLLKENRFSLMAWWPGDCRLIGVSSLI
jgi:hypothetical protein